MQEDKEKLRIRSLRKAAYILEDLDESRNRIDRVGLICLVIGFIWLLSYIIFKGNCLYHSLISIALGATIILFKRIVGFNSSGITIIFLIGYLAVLLSEFLLIGYPSKLLPMFDELNSVNMVNVINVINDGLPVLYYPLQFGAAFFFGIIIYNYRLASGIPEETIKEIQKEGLVSYKIN